MDIRTIEEIMDAFKGRLELSQLEKFVQGLVNLRLMFCDGRSVLSLAVRGRSACKACQETP